MRPIKFRVWDKQEKKMLQWGSGVIAINHQLSVETVPSGKLLKHSDIELMQFTGLLDANDREIYEGDIVLTENEQQGAHPCEESYEGVVTYQGDAFHIVQSHDTYTPTLKNITIQHIEVIGNIYENSNLINEVKQET